MYLGMIPEANVDLAVSVSQLNYDMDRLSGVRPGGSIEISTENIDAVVGQLLYYDSPLQDFVNFLSQ